jgi:hypothetical protein
MIKIGDGNMFTRKFLKIYILVLLLTAITYAQELLTERKFPDKALGKRCGTLTPTLEEVLRVEAEIKHGGNRSNSPLTGCPPTTITIPVAVHVVRMDDGSRNVTNQEIYDQIQVLNNAYQNTHFQFSLLSIDRTNNSDWSIHYLNSRAEEDMKAALSIDPKKILNFYICTPRDVIDGKLAGYAWFPWDFQEDDTMHGVVIRYTTLPGNGSFFGITAVHEVGHYLGLFHTFENGCNAPGDLVDDTPYEASQAPTAEPCPEGLDTCPDDPGEDPIHNFMNYGRDECLNEFTPGQAELMDEMVALYKPKLLVYSSPADLALTTVIVPIGEQKCWRAANSITAPTVSPQSFFVVEGDGTNGGHATFTAGNTISLLPGFSVQPGGYFWGALAGLEEGTNASSKPVLSGRVKTTLKTAEKDSVTALAIADQLHHLTTVVPDEFDLSQNYPNPFNPTTTIKYTLKEDVKVSLKIYNMLGQEVRNLVDESQTAGLREVVWNGKNDFGQQVASGVYIYRMVAGNFIQIRRMILLK